MKRFFRKDIRDILVIFIALAVPLLMAWSVRSRPLEASTAVQFQALIRDSRQDEILTPMSLRYEGMSLNFEAPDDSEANSARRWQEIQTSLQNNGVEEDAAGEIVLSAQSVLGQAWPCFAERGYLQQQPVWLVVGSSPTSTGFTAWICPPSAQDIRQEKVRKYCSDINVAIVSAKSPYPVLN